MTFSFHWISFQWMGLTVILIWSPVDAIENLAHIILNHRGCKHFFCLEYAVPQWTYLCNRGECEILSIEPPSLSLVLPSHIGVLYFSGNPNMNNKVDPLVLTRFASPPVCDGTRNVERYRYRYFFRYQIFSIPIPVLFSVPNFSDTGSETFFRYQILPIPVPRLFSVPNFSDTGSDTTWKN